LPKIVPHLWYDKEAEEAAEFYTSLFESSNIWQVLPSNWEEICYSGTEEQQQRVNGAMLAMKKIDLEALERAKLGISDA